MKPLPQKYAMGSDWLAGSVCCNWLNGPHLSSMCSGWILNSGVLYIAYQFEPDWDAENISKDDCAEPVQARLLMVCFLFVFVSYF